MEGPRPQDQRFGAGLTEIEVRRFQTILREDCGVEVGLPEAWSRAIQVLTLAETLLSSDAPDEPIAASGSPVRAPSHLTESRS